MIPLANIVECDDGSLGVVDGAPWWLLCLVRDLEQVGRRMAPWPELRFDRRGRPIEEEPVLSLDELRELVTTFAGVFPFASEPLSDGAVMSFCAPSEAAFRARVPAGLTARLQQVAFRHVATAFALDRISAAISACGNADGGTEAARAVATAASFMFVAGVSTFRPAASELEALGKRHAVGGNMRRQGSAEVKARVLLSFRDPDEQWPSKRQAAEVLAERAIIWAAQSGWKLTGSPGDQFANMVVRVRRWLSGEDGAS